MATFELTEVRDAAGRRERAPPRAPRRPPPLLRATRRCPRRAARPVPTTPLPAAPRRPRRCGRPAAPQSAQRDREEQEKLLAEFELRRKIRATLVPTDDAKVREMLRGLGEPITLFGEREVRKGGGCEGGRELSMGAGDGGRRQGDSSGRPAPAARAGRARQPRSHPPAPSPPKQMERRDRLKKIIAERDVQDLAGAPVTGELVMEEQVVIHKEVFYTEGPPELQRGARGGAGLERWVWQGFASWFPMGSSSSSCCCWGAVFSAVRTLLVRQRPAQPELTPAPLIPLFQPLSSPQRAWT
jgi:hypothetical protein